MSIVVALAHAAKLPAAAAIIDVGLLIAYMIFLAPAALIALWVAAAWFFLSDQPRQRYR